MLPLYHRCLLAHTIVPVGEKIIISELIVSEEVIVMTDQAVLTTASLSLTRWMDWAKTEKMETHAGKIRR